MALPHVLPWMVIALENCAPRDPGRMVKHRTWSSIGHCRWERKSRPERRDHCDFLALRMLTVRVAYLRDETRYFRDHLQRISDRNSDFGSWLSAAGGVVGVTFKRRSAFYSVGHSKVGRLLRSTHSGSVGDDRPKISTLSLPSGSSQSYYTGLSFDADNNTVSSLQRALVQFEPGSRDQFHRRRV